MVLIEVNLPVAVSFRMIRTHTIFVLLHYLLGLRLWSVLNLFNLLFVFTHFTICLCLGFCSIQTLLKIRKTDLIISLIHSIHTIQSISQNGQNDIKKEE